MAVRPHKLRCRVCAHKYADDGIGKVAHFFGRNFKEENALEKELDEKMKNGITVRITVTGKRLRQKEMHVADKKHEFERVAELRDQIRELEMTELAVGLKV